MDRNIVYPGSIPLDTDILGLNRNAMVGIAALTAAVLGSSVVVDGLACSPTSPASLSVNVAPGSITQLSPLDANAYGSLAADITDQIVKTGINLQSTSFTLAPPSTSGQSINYLIEAAFEESDSSPVVLPYVNAAAPSQPYSGPNNSGTAQNTQRIQRVQLQLKPGAAANAGSQTTPAVDAGWVGLYVITVNYGQTAVTASNIATMPGAPFVNYKLPALRPGFAAMQVFTASGSFVVPNGVSTVRVTVFGGGGSGGYHSTMPGGGGGAGGQAVGIVTGLTPGQSITVTVGAGGAAPGAPQNGNSGGMSSFGTYLSATGGSGGSGGTMTQFAMAGGAGGTGVGGQLNRGGSYGGDSIVVASRGGDGGGPGNGRASSGPIPGLAATGFGGGGGGGGMSSGSLGSGGGGGGYYGGVGGDPAAGGGGSYFTASGTPEVNAVGGLSGGNGEVLIDPAPTPCYLRGTLILTSRGEVPVEALRIGDLVATVGGFGEAVKPIIWIGYTPFDATRHPRPHQVWPIRVLAGAFVDGLPRRDLLVSPCHAFLIDGVLMQAGMLTNGASIFQDRSVSRGEYYHVELDAHDILLAEGVPAESFLDNGNRRAFANEPAFRELYPDFSPKHWTDTCVPLVLSGPLLAEAKTQLLERAEAVGFDRDTEPDIHLITDNGERIDPVSVNNGWYHFDLRGGGTTHLMSRAWVPAEHDPDSNDIRELGVCVGSLVLDERRVSLDQLRDGWRAAERSAIGTWRWTKGGARLPRAATSIAVQVTGVGRYWLHQNAALADDGAFDRAA